MVVAGVHHLLRISTDRVTATVSTLSILLLFGFCQHMAVGNYNFICPYEATHGVVLSIGILIAV
jgi:hypothetical protein